MASYVFGAGNLFVLPLTAIDGTAITTPTPVRILTMQEMSLDVSGDVKELYGANQYPEVVAVGKRKVGGKFKGARYYGQAIANLLGNTMTAGTLYDCVVDNTGTAIPATPFQLTPTVPGSGTYISDLGVINASGVPMTRVTGTPTTGQYSMSGGVYTFAAADTGLIVYINFYFSQTSAGAKKIAITNTTIGSAPTFKTFLHTTFNGKRVLAIGYNTLVPKLAFLGTKQDDFSMQDIDFSCFQDAASSSVMDLIFSE